MNRSNFIRQFNQFLSVKTSQIWLIYGISGIGKSYHLEVISKESFKQNRGCLLIKSPTQGQESQLSESILRQASVAGESVMDCSASEPANFLKLCRKLQNISPLELLEKETATNDSITGAAKLTFMIPRLLGLYKFKEHPEKNLLEALRKDLSSKPLTLLFDDHEISAKTLIKTKLKKVDSQGVAEWGHGSDYITENFYAWLGKLIRYLSCSNNPIFVVITGQKPLQAIKAIDLGRNTKIHRETWLSPFTHSDIADFLETIEQFSKLPKEQLAVWCERILKITSGLPKWVVELFTVLKNTSNNDMDLLLQDMEQLLTSDGGLGVQDYLINQLTNHQHFQDKVWRLALPYRIEGSAEFQELLFPEWSQTPEEGESDAFTALFDAGVLQRHDLRSNNYTLHQVTLSTLKKIAHQHTEEATLLHQCLSDYYRKHGNAETQEAESYHKLCARYGARLSSLGMTGEDYWFRTKSSFGLTLRQKSDWLTKTLPLRDSSIQKRISRLEEEYRTLTLDMAGDADEFLKLRLRKNENVLQGLSDKKTLVKWSKQVPHISDLQFLLSQMEPDIGKRLQALSTLVRDVNPYHTLAWFELGLLKWRQGEHGRAKTALTHAVNLGLSEQRKQLAKAYLNWLSGKLGSATEGFEYIFSEGQSDLQADIKLLSCIRKIQKSNLNEIKVKDYRISNAKFESSLKQALSNTDLVEAYHLETVIDPKSSRAWFNLGDLMCRLSLYKEAKEAYSKMINLDPENSSPWVYVGFSLLRLKRYKEAEEAIRKAVALDPDNFRAWLNLGRLLAELQRDDEAEEAFRKAITLEPGNSSSWEDFGAFLKQSGSTRYKEIEEAYLKAVSIDPESSVVWYGLGAFYTDCVAEYPKGKQCFLKALRLQPDRWRPWVGIGINIEKETGVANRGSFFNSIGLAIDNVLKGTATTSEYLLAATKVYLPYQCWYEILHCTKHILVETPRHPKALGLSALAHSYLGDSTNAHRFSELALQEETFQVFATFSKIKLLMDKGNNNDALMQLHELYDIAYHGSDYFIEMRFMEHFSKLKDSEYVWRCAQNAKNKAEKYYFWVPEYQLALYYWQVEKNIPEAQAIIKIFRVQSRHYGEHSIIDLLEAEICFITGNIRRCQNLLRKISQDQITPDSLLYASFTEEEEQRFKLLFYNIEQLNQCCGDNH